MSEAGGRFHIKDVINFLYYSRGSMRETKFWLRRTITRKLMEQGKAEKLINRINNLAPQLNSYIASKRKRKSNPGNPAT
jgi:four helix bundle protein